MSNSPVVKFRAVGLPGPEGLSGPTGGTGATGATGGTGATGAYGRYYSSFRVEGNNIFLTYSDGTTASLNGTFRGSTYADKTTNLVKGSNTGPNAAYGLLYNVSGGTFFMKGLCAYGSLRASMTGANNEYISIDTIYWGKDLIGNYDPTTMSPGKLLYLGTPTVVYGDGITHSPITAENTSRGISGAFNFEIAGSDSTSYHLNAGSRVLSLGPFKKGALIGFTGGNLSNGEGSTTGVFLDANSAGTFVLHTPIGIRGISGSFNTNEIASITVLIDSDDVWTFPQNIYFEPDENYLSCGKNILGLMTYDGGNTWIATPAHRGHGINNAASQCIPGYLFGSCCYENIDGTLECKDYTTRSECDKLFGSFNPATSCENSCGTKVGICCSGLGDCLEGISVSLCDKFGGTFWAGVTCSDFGTGSNYEQVLTNGRFCYDPCSSVKSVCCKNGKCLGNYTRVQCELILGGKALTAASCEEADCCDHNTVNGACCICSQGSYQCVENLSPSACKAQGGAFMGPGKKCNEVSCGCLCGSGAVETGSCCTSTGCIDNVTSSFCTSRSGTFITGTSCSTDPCNANAIHDGICCVSQVDTNNNPTGFSSCLPTARNRTQCEAAGGAWYDKARIYQRDDADPSTTLGKNVYTLDYQFRSPDDCEFCNRTRYVQKLTAIPQESATLWNGSAFTLNLADAQSPDSAAPTSFLATNMGIRPSKQTYKKIFLSTDGTTWAYNTVPKCQFTPIGSNSDNFPRIIHDPLFYDPGMTFADGGIANGVRGDHVSGNTLFTTKWTQWNTSEFPPECTLHWMRQTQENCQSCLRTIVDKYLQCEVYPLENAVHWETGFWADQPLNSLIMVNTFSPKLEEMLNESNQQKLKLFWPNLHINPPGLNNDVRSFFWCGGVGYVCIDGCIRSVCGFGSDGGISPDNFNSYEHLYHLLGIFEANNITVASANGQCGTCRNCSSGGGGAGPGQLGPPQQVACATPNNLTCYNTNNSVYPKSPVNPACYIQNGTSGFTVPFVIKNVKMYLNSTEYICVPVVCADSTCSDYELCGES